MSEQTVSSGQESPGEDLPTEELPDSYELPGATEQPCANHPNRVTMVTCSNCSKPLCPDCMVYSAVGIKCKECATPPRSALATLKTSKFLLAIAAGLWTATALGFAYYYILGGIRFFFVFIFVSAGIGYLVGEVISRTSGRYHGLKTAITAAGATIWAFVLPHHGCLHQLWRQLEHRGVRLVCARHHQLGRDAFCRVPRLEP